MAAAASSSKWCWVVAVACCWINFCLLGVLRSSAVVYVALVDTFGVSREIAAWPSGLFSFTMCLTGGFSGCLCQYFKIRSIMMVAAILASLSVSLCYFATNIQHIVILYGAFQGIGMGLIVPLTHVIINQHFVKKRAVATGIAYAGSSAGSFVFLALTQTMIAEYDLPGTFLLLGGIMLNSVLGIALFRDPPKTCSPAASKEQNRQKVNHAIQECNPGESRPSTERKNCQIQKTRSCSSMASVCFKDEKGQSVGNDVSPTKGVVKQNDRYFRDKHQSYDLLFVFLGILQIGITIVWLLESTFCRKVLQRTASA